MELTVKRLNDFEYEVDGKGVQSEVFYIDQWTSKVNGKGSRKFKEEILKAVETFVIKEKQDFRKKKEDQIQAQRLEMMKSLEYRNINLLRLYEVELHYYDTYYGHFMNHKGLLTGYEITQSDKVVSFNDHHINNTDIYSVGHVSDWGYRVQNNDRVFIVSYGAYVTGLGLKEMIYNGLQSHEDIRLVKGAELETIRQYGDNNPTAFMLFDSTGQADKMKMKQRYIKEMKRAENTKFEVEKQYTEDGKEIKKAWFMSKPITFKDIERMEIASYQSYVIDESVTVSKDAFDKFVNGFDMEVLSLNDPFEGGTYQDDNATYSSVLEVACNEYDYKLLVDPQGFDYARYVAMIK